MRSLELLIKELETKRIIGPLDKAVSSLVLRSDEVQKGSLFVAWHGLRDGHEYISDAISRGAITVVCEHLPDELDSSVTYIEVENAQATLGEIASRWFDNPSEKLKLVGVTGTNGKTTIATLLYQLFEEMGYKAGLLSTIENRIHKKTVVSKLTTLDPISLNRALYEMVENDISYAFMEVSSHAADQSRISGLHFTGGIFSNITHDHLDYHNIFSDYLLAKQSFFDMLHSHAFALANSDDENGKFILQNTKAGKYFYGLKTGNDFDIDIQKNDFSGLNLSINGMTLKTSLVGNYNAYNLGAVFGSAILLGETKEKISRAMGKLHAPEGRFFILKGKNGTIGIVDYAHTPDAIKNVLQTLRDLAGNKKIVTVIGCGGDRDKKKRPKMAQVAGSLSDFVVLTSDNPRTEDPVSIINEMEKGLGPIDRTKVYSIPSRAEAIEAAVRDIASDGDIIAVLGKGHEKYQIIGDEWIPFDDVSELKKAFLDDE